MHNGIFESLEQVIDFFDQGGGRGNTTLKPLKLSVEEKKALKAFLIEVGATNVHELREPSMGGEDFAYYRQKYPGALFRVGVGPNPSLHSDTFDYNDGALEIGMGMLAGVAIDLLANP